MSKIGDVIEFVLSEEVALHITVTEKLLADAREVEDEPDCQDKRCDTCSLSAGMGSTSLCEVQEIMDRILDGELWLMKRT